MQVHAEYEDLGALLADTPELASARLLCPRYLEPDTAYLACVVPSFEAGRMAGLGLEPPADSVALAWEEQSADLRLPVFHSWSFRTAPQAADFEELVRRLEPQPLGPDVGVHDLDLSEPGSTRLPDDLVTVGYEGPLGSPDMEVPRWREPGKSEFQAAMGSLLADAAPGEPRAEGQPYVASRHDPVVAPPRYGTLPSGIDRIPAPGEARSPETPIWLSEANLDPKHRAAAGLGAEVVRINQEALMADAWDQALGLRQVNRLLTRTRLALEVGRGRLARLEALSDGALLQVTAGAHARLAGGRARITVRGHHSETTMPAGLVSGAFRRASRPGGTLAKSVTREDQDQAGVTGRLTAAFSSTPETMLKYATLTVPNGVDVTLLEREQELQAELKADLGIDIGLDFEAQRRAARARAPSARQIANVAVDSVFGLIDHVASDLGIAVVLDRELDLADLAGLVRTAMEPTEVLSARLRTVIQPAEALGAEPVPAGLSAAPLLPVALYRKLVNIDPELLMPGVGSLPPDSVGLAVINQAAVEAFLLGANHGFARELLWREYPADLAGTWLRTFWESGGAAQDIAAIADWKTGALGSNWTTGDDPAQMLVLVVKGDLLRRYPNTLVTAVPAKWSGGLRQEDTKAKALDPLFSGSLGSDAVFLAFEFDEGVHVETDVAGSADPDDQLPGWYFAFEEPPTEPSYGLDTAESDESPALEFWKDLTWDDARDSPSDTHVALGSLGSTELPYDELGAQHLARDLGRDLGRHGADHPPAPVRMLVHADQMLTPEVPGG